jgi:hypothetical protein
MRDLIMEMDEEAAAGACDGADLLPDDLSLAGMRAALVLHHRRLPQTADDHARGSCDRCASVHGDGQQRPTGDETTHRCNGCDYDVCEACHGELVLLVRNRKIGESAPSGLGGRPIVDAVSQETHEPKVAEAQVELTADAVFEAIDTDGNGRVSLAEFEQWWNARQEGTGRPGASDVPSQAALLFAELNTVRARPRRLNGLSVFRCKSFLYGVVV